MIERTITKYGDKFVLKEIMKDGEDIIGRFENELINTHKLSIELQNKMANLSEGESLILISK